MSWDKVLSKHQQQFRYCCVLLFWERISWSSILLPLRGMQLSLQSIVSKKIMPILQTQHFFKVMSPWATMAGLQPKAQEGLALWIPPPQWLLGRLGHGEECLFLTVFFRLSLSYIFIFCCLAKAKSLDYPFLLATTCFLFVLMFDRRCTAVGTCPEEAWRTLWKPTNFSENLTPSSKSNATVIISRRWRCFQSGLSFPTTKPIDLKVSSSSLQKEVALILFSNTKFCWLSFLILAENCRSPHPHPIWFLLIISKFIILGFFLLVCLPAFLFYLSDSLPSNNLAWAISLCFLTLCLPLCLGWLTDVIQVRPPVGYFMVSKVLCTLHTSSL